MKRFAVAFLLSSVAAGFYLRAQSAGLRSKFDAFDANKDGVIAGEEMNASPVLAPLDLDRDGRLTLLEAARALRRKSAPDSSAASAEPAPGDRRLFDFLDKNKDGRLVEGELPRKLWFDRLDTNKNGAVTFEEADAVVARMKELGEKIPAIPGAPAPESPVAEPPVEDLTEAPRILKAGEHGVGSLVADALVKDLSGQEKHLRDHVVGSKGLVIAFFGATCPISGKLGPELARLEKDLPAQGLRMILVCPVAAETREDIEKFVSAHAMVSPVVHDTKGRLSAALAATTTTEVFLLDSARTLFYRGAVNDQYGLGYARESATRTYLRDAVKSLLKGVEPEVAATTAPGCALDLKMSGAVVKSDITYHNQVERILKNRCVECHHQSGVGPFSLESYEEVIENAGMIRKQVERGAMPPWFAAAPSGNEESPWINDCSLSKREKSDLLAWLAGDRSRGDPAEAPLKRTFSFEWQLGKPDAVLQLPHAVSIKAEGTMPYQFLTVDTGFTEDRWVRGYEILPTDASVVHHVIVQVHPKGSKVRNRGEGSEGYWAAYVPGNTHHLWPEGYAKKLPAGAIVSFQIHYTPNGRATQDQLRLGLHFSTEEPRHIVHTAAVANLRLNIPPGAPNHVESKEQAVPFDMNVMAFMAHMHLRGKAFKFEVTQPDGRQEVLLDIPRYDFNWQLRYDYARSHFLPRGSRFRITAVFDNSEGNPANPDPSKTVRWGAQTFDEMMIGYIEYSTPNKRDVAAR